MIQFSQSDVDAVSECLRRLASRTRREALFDAAESAQVHNRPKVLLDELARVRAIVDEADALFRGALARAGVEVDVDDRRRAGIRQALAEYGTSMIGATR